MTMPRKTFPLELDAAELVTVSNALRMRMDSLAKRRKSPLWTRADEAAFKRMQDIRGRITELRKSVPFAERGGR